MPNHLQRRVAQYLLEPQWVADFLHQVVSGEGVTQEVGMKARDASGSANPFHHRFQAARRERVA
jgi:hypothetical protein